MITLLGLNPSPARYGLEGREVATDLAPVALLELLPASQQPERILALCTAEAKENTGRKLIKRLAGKCVAQLVDVPAGHDQEHVEQFLRAVTREVPDRVELTVDITHGLRHFSFLTYASLLYLAELKGVRVRAVYYGLLGQGKDGSSPFLDLHPLLELPRWARALHTLRTTGSALPITELLSRGEKGQVGWEISNEFRYLAEAYLSGLPLELGQRAWRIKDHFMKPLTKILRVDHRLPMSRELANLLAEGLTPHLLEGVMSGEGWKGKVPLTKDELSRQAAVINSLLSNGHLHTALRLIQEWTISWVIFNERMDTEDWLNHRQVRSRAKNLLYALTAIGKDPDLAGFLTDSQRSIGKNWDDLTGLRNGFAHHGMRKQILIGDRQIEKKLEAVKTYWRHTLGTIPELSLSIGGCPGGRILVSPIGRRPGVLYSALNACHADEHSEGLKECLVICSEETEVAIGEVLEQAGYDGNVTLLRLEDPFGGGSGEIRRLRKKARRHLVGVDEVLVNVTGGTTLMGLVAEGIASEARRFARPTRRFGLVDRRPAKEQDTDPYQASDVFWLGLD